MAGSSSEHVMKFIADFSQVGPALAAFSAEAKAAASKAVAIPAGQNRTPTQRVESLAVAQGQARAAVTHAHDMGVFGPKGDPDTARRLKQVQQEQNRIFRTAREDAGLPKSTANSQRINDLTNQAKAEQLALYQRATTDAQRQHLFDGNITKAKQLILKSEIRRGVISEEAGKAALAELAAEAKLAKQAQAEAAKPAKKAPQKRAPKVEPPLPPVIDQAQLDADAGAAAAAEAAAKPKPKTRAIKPEVVQPVPPVDPNAVLPRIGEDSFYADPIYGPQAKALEAQIEAQVAAANQAGKEGVAANQAGNAAAEREALIREELADVRAEELQVALSDLQNEYTEVAVARRQGELQAQADAAATAALEQKTAVILEGTATEVADGNGGKRKPRTKAASPPPPPPPPVLPADPGFFDDDMSDEEIDAALQAQADANFAAAKAAEANAEATAEVAAADTEVAASKKKRSNRKKKKERERTAAQIKEDESLVVRVSPEEVAARTDPRNVGQGASAKELNAAEIEASKATSRALAKQRALAKKAADEAAASIPIISSGKLEPGESAADRKAKVEAARIRATELRIAQDEIEAKQKEQRQYRARRKAAEAREFRLSPEGKAAAAAAYKETPEAKASAARREKIVSRTPAAEQVAQQKAEEKARLEQREIEDARKVAKAQLLAEEKAAGKVQRELTEEEIHARIKTVRAEQERARLKGVLTAEQAKRILEEAESPRPTSFKPSTKDQDAAQLARDSVLRQRAKIAEQDILLGNEVRDTSQLSYVDGLKVRAAQQKQARAIAKETAATEAQAAQSEKILIEAQLADKAGLRATIDLAAAKKKLATVIAAGVEATLQADAQYVAVTRQIAALKQRSALAELAYLNTPAGQVVTQDAAKINAGNTINTAKQNALEAQILAADANYLQNRIQAAAITRSTNAREEAAVAQRLAADTAYINAQRQLAVTKQQSALAELAYQKTDAAGQAFVAGEAQLQVERLGIEATRNAVKFELLAADTVQIAEKAKAIVLEEQYNRLLKEEVQAQAVQVGLTKKGLLARITQGGRGGGGRFGIGDNGGAGGFFAQGGAQTLKHAVPSLLLFGAAAGIAATVKSATDLEKEMNQIEAQFIATDQAAEFPRFKQSILDIARDAGLAAEQVAEIGFQLQGAFGGGEEVAGLSGTSLVGDQLEASAEIAKVTGLSQKEIVDSLTAASFAFDASFRDIGDVTLQLQDRFGVLAKEIIPFLGDIAPVANAAGFSLEEFATIAALTQQKSGRSGTALAEAYGRVLPALSEAKEELYQLAQTNNSLNTPEFLQAVAKGDAAPIFLGLSAAFQDMNKSSQDFVINLLGGRREASAILAAFEDSEKLMTEINQTSRDNNVLAARYEKLQETLSQQAAKLAEEFRQFGIDLYEAGLGDALKVLVSSFTFLVGALGDIVTLFGGFNNLLGGMPGKLLAILAVIKLIQVTMGSDFGKKIGNIPTNISNAAARGPSLAGVAGNAAGAFDTVRSQGFRGPGRVTGSQGAIGGSSIAQVGSVLIAAYAVSELQNTREDYKGKINEAGDTIVANLSAASEKEADKFIAERNTWADQVRSDGWVATITPYLVGAKSIQERGIDARQQQDAPRILAALEAFKNLPTPDFNKDEDLLDEVIANFQSDPTNDQFYEDARQYLILAAQVSREARNAINGRLGQSQAVSDAQVAADEAAAEATLSIGSDQQDLEAIIADFDAGRATGLEVQRAYEKLIKSYEIALSGTLQDPATKKLLQEAELAKSKFLSEQILSANELTQTLNAATGGGGPEAEIAGLQAALRNPAFDDAAARRQAALDIVSLNQELLQQRADAADGAGEALQILTNGIPLDADTRVTLILEQLRGNNQVQEFLEGFNGAARKTVGFLQDGSDEIAAVMVETGKSYKEAALAVIEQAIADKLSLLSYSTLSTEARAVILRGLSSLYGQKEELKNIPDVDINDVRNVTGSSTEIADQQREAWDEAAAYAQEQADKLEEWRQAALEIEDAKADLFKATIENDPLAAARFEQSEADRALRNAKTEAERIAAQAARIRADRGFREAIQDIYASQADLMQAVFDYGGNSVEGAKLGLKTAKDRLAYLQASGAGDAAINRAKGDVITAQGGLRDARLDRKLQDYAFLYDMDKINKQQYIAYLMQLKEIPDLTTDQLRTLDRQIKSLRDELGADFQFNLPTTLGLPTLYEVRRTNQTPGGGGSYQDMRNYNIVLYVNNGMDQAAAEQFLSEAMGTNRVSTGTRRY